jgi:flagellar biosynthesis protein FlhG
MRDDQATGLRQLFDRPRASAWGVVGLDATPLALDLALALTRIGRRVVALDGSCGDIARAFGLRVRYELSHALAGDKRLSEVLFAGSEGLSVLPAARGMARIEEGGVAGFDALLRTLAAPPTSADVVLCNGLPAAARGMDIVLALAPTTVSLTAAYAELKRLARDEMHGHCRVVIDGARTERAANDAFASVAATARRFLGIELEFAGALIETRPRHAPLAPAAEHSARARAVLRIAEHLAAADAPAQRRVVNH